MPKARKMVAVRRRGDWVQIDAAVWRWNRRRRLERALERKKLKEQEAKWSKK